uniref:Attractin/MKLN-like beta-propeller domain-containing protein n=1 Tax=Kalanchoe fedtschenkoi TaxID=63787 RepID=A0A7N0UYB7_KALFE
MRWEKHPTHPRGPGRRWGHSCNAVHGGKLVYVFGGYGQENCQTNKVHVFDTATQVWSEPEMKGVPPTPRDSHTCNAVGDYLYVFGGTDGKGPLNDLYILDTTSNTWLWPSIRGEGPEPREGHGAALVGRRLYIFGGCGKSSDGVEEIYYNDLYVLNTETLTWKRAVTAGIPPSPRDSHTCSSWKNLIIVIGGEDENDYYLSDVHIFDTETSIWRALNTSGDKLQPRGGHTTVSFGKNLIVFGGFTDEHDLYDDLHMLDIENGLWSKLFTEGEGPSGRFSVAGDCLDPTRIGALMFIGGCNRSLEALDDMYYLNTGLMMEHGRDGRRLEKLSLRKQLKLKCQLSQPVHDRTLLKAGTVAEPCTSAPVTLYNQPSQSIVPYESQGIRSFQAKVTQSLSSGFAIETVIDGKLLRGIIFSSSGSKQKSNCNFSRKNPTVKAGGATDTKQNEPNIAAPMELAGDLHGKGSEFEARSDGDKGPEKASVLGAPDLNERDDVLAPTASQMLQGQNKTDSGQGCSTSGQKQN